MTVLAKYANGNTTVTIMDDGTKIRESDGVPVADHPESIDVKITDYCDMGCSYCHESSTKEGVHADLDALLGVLGDLPPGVELAIGGGNPMSHPRLFPFLGELKEMGLIANITVNQGHLPTYGQTLVRAAEEGLVKGIGISITNKNYKFLGELMSASGNVVHHVIAGVNDVSVLDDLMALGECKVLVLGYKIFGFGVSHYSEDVEAGIMAWRKALPRYMGRLTMSFDNLAIEQLNVRELFTTEGWARFYMGDDYTFTMYIDAVKREYAPTSRSKDRVPFSECSLEEYFGRRPALTS